MFKTLPADLFRHNYNEYKNKQTLNQRYKIIIINEYVKIK